MSIEQIIEDATQGDLYEICERAGYRIGGQFAWDERVLRATVLDDYQADRISGRGIVSVIEGRKDLLAAANRIISEQNRTIAAMFMRLRELEASTTLGQFEVAALMRQAREQGRQVGMQIDRTNSDQFTDLLDQMFRMRAREFQDRLKWDVVVVNGREVDDYDNEYATYLLVVKDGKVTASVRLIPTTGRTMLGDHFFHIAPPPDPNVWEATRFCGEPSSIFALAKAMTEFGLAQGLTSIVGCFDAASYRIYRHACKSVGCELDIIGHHAKIHCGRFEISQLVLDKLIAKLERE
jgi:N-acyl-L-homoserine lactone synthetase